MMNALLWLVAGFLVAKALGNKEGTSGLGAGPRRFGNPRTDEERRQEHFKRFGTTELPPRGQRFR